MSIVRAIRTGSASMTLASDYTHRMTELNNLYRGYTGPAFAIRFPMWSWRSAAYAEAKFSLIFRSSKAFDKLMQQSETALGEAFVSGEMEVEGDLFSAL